MFVLRRVLCLYDRVFVSLIYVWVAGCNSVVCDLLTSLIFGILID